MQIIKISKCLVTGCSGFLGQKLCLSLIKEGYKVYGIDICPCPINEVIFTKVDLEDKEALIKCMRGIDTVFHVAAAPYKSSRDLIWRVNVNGTKNVIDACLENKVSRLIYTSSCSVVFQGKEVINGKEDMPYTRKTWWFNDTYGQSKAEGERLVLSSNQNNGLLTIALRPHNIYGPGDRLFVPQIAAKAKMLIFGMGDGKNLFSTTHSSNCVHAHILAAKALETKGSEISGQAFNINDGESGNFWDKSFQIASEIADIPREKLGRIWIPRFIGLTIAFIAELFGRITGKEISINWIAMILMTTTRTYSIEKAQKELGYKPIISMEDGFRETIKEAKEKYLKEKKSAIRRPYLSYWLFFIASLSLFGTVLAFFKPDTLIERQFSTAANQVSPLAGRFYGSWTLLATLIRYACALNPYNTAVYRLTIISFFLALGVYSGETFIHKTSLLFPESFMPFMAASSSLIWMIFFPPKEKTE